MPFVLLIVGAVLLVASVRNTQGELFTLVKGDFTGPNNFVYWFLSILVIGAVGYIPRLKPISTAFLTLVILVLFLARGNPKAPGGGFFQQLINQLKSTTQPTPTANNISTPIGGTKPPATWTPDEALKLPTFGNLF